MGAFVVLEVKCSSRDPRFAGSNPVEVDGFFRDIKIQRTNRGGPESHISGSSKNLKARKKIASEQNLIGVFTS